MEDRHVEIVERGLELHEAHNYEAALTVFEAARLFSPHCPVVTYNIANTLHMLDRDAESSALLRSILDAPDPQLIDQCSQASPRSLRLDALYLMFLSTLHASKSWRVAVPYLRKHLASRSRGLSSVFSKARVVREAEGLRQSFAPRSKPVLQRST